MSAGMTPDKLRRQLEETAQQRQMAAEIQEKAGKDLRRLMRLVNNTKVIPMAEAARKAGISRVRAYEVLKEAERAAPSKGAGDGSKQ